MHSLGFNLNNLLGNNYWFFYLNARLCETRFLVPLCVSCYFSPLLYLLRIVTHASVFFLSKMPKLPSICKLNPQTVHQNWTPRERSENLAGKNLKLENYCLLSLSGNSPTPCAYLLSVERMPSWLQYMLPADTLLSERGEEDWAVCWVLCLRHYV